MAILDERTAFRIAFRDFEDGCLIDVAELGHLLCTTKQAVYKKLLRTPESLPPPFIRTSRQLRWRVAEVRAWLSRELVTPSQAGTEFQKGQVSGSAQPQPRKGRPRMPIELPRR